MTQAEIALGLADDDEEDVAVMNYVIANSNLESATKEFEDASTTFEAAFPLPLNPSAEELMAAASQGIPGGLAVDESRITAENLLDFPDEEDSDEESGDNPITDVQCDLCDEWCVAASEPSLRDKPNLAINSESFYCQVCRALPGFSARAEAAALSIQREFSEATRPSSDGADSSVRTSDVVHLFPRISNQLGRLEN